MSIALNRGAALAILLLASAVSGAAHGVEASDAKRIFNQRCTACHSFGKGVKVGPDLKGVTERRRRPWLLSFVRSSQGVIKSGDPVAGDLWRRFKGQRMPDWTDLSEKQIGAILDWLAVNGPEQREPDERNAELATARELELARTLFNGESRLTHGGLACASCHTMFGVGRLAGGSLGPDLSDTYARYRDRALTMFLKSPCFQRAPARGEYLTPQESFALKAYMRLASLQASLHDSERAGK